MASITENTLKIMESTTATATRTVPAQSSQRKTNINRKSARKEEDLSHYEQMVIMKKNPYLDLKELEQRLYNPGSKKVRASLAGGDVAVGICDEGPYVEIINRGLSGFAIPSKLMKATGAAAPAPDGKPKVPAPAPSASIADTITKKTEQEDRLLTNLVKDIKKFEESKLLVY